VDGTGAPCPTESEPEDLVTLRVEKLLHYQTVRLSFFGFWSLDEPGVHLRPSVSYDLSDAVRITAGASLFDGDTDTTFGSFDESDSVFGRLRYSF
jgi:hypothetical protein